MARQTHSRKPAKKPAAQARRPAGSSSTARTSRNSERARRQRALRRKRQNFLFRLICGILICIVVVLAPTIFFRVAHVTVSGDTRYTEQELIDASGVHNGDNMFFLDSDHIASVMEEQYPYLGTVRLHKKLPSTLQIEVTDRVAVLSVETDSEYLLMDISGKVLEKTTDAAPDTMVVCGADASGLEVGDTISEDQEKLQTVLDLMQLITQYELDTDVSSIDIEKAYDVHMQYADRYTILLGSLSDLEKKIQFLQAILKEPSLPETGVIDLTDEKEARYRPADVTPVEDNSTDEEQDGESEDADTSSEDNADEEEGSADESGGDQNSDSGTETDEETAGFMQFGKVFLKLSQIG